MQTVAFLPLVSTSLPADEHDRRQNGDFTTSTTTNIERGKRQRDDSVRVDEDVLA